MTRDTDQYCARCDVRTLKRVCPRCSWPTRPAWVEDDDTWAETSGREKDDDDGEQYADPGDELAERRAARLAERD